MAKIQHKWRDHDYGLYLNDKPMNAGWYRIKWHDTDEYYTIEWVYIKNIFVPYITVEYHGYSAELNLTKEMNIEPAPYTLEEVIVREYSKIPEVTVIYKFNDTNTFDVGTSNHFYSDSINGRLLIAEGAVQDYAYNFMVDYNWDMAMDKFVLQRGATMIYQRMAE